MIDLEVFGDEINGLSEYFGKAISPKQERRLYLILNAELTTDEFKQAVIAAYRNCKFFPTPCELIESVYGSIEDRAIKQWDNTDRLSEVGREAFSSVGGSWARQNADKPDILRSQFIKAYKSYSVGATPDRLKMPAPMVVLPRYERHVEYGREPSEPKPIELPEKVFEVYKRLMEVRGLKGNAIAISEAVRNI